MNQVEDLSNELPISTNSETDLEPGILTESALDAAESRLREGEQRRKRTKQKIKNKNFKTIDTPERLKARMTRVLEDQATRNELEREGFNITESLESLGDSIEEFDNSILERIINGENFLGVNFFDLGKRAARGIGRVDIRTPSGKSGTGTGSMVTSRLLLTNNHVLRDASWAQKSKVTFDFEDDIDGNPRQTVTFDLAPEAFFVTDPRLDFTLVAVKQTSFVPPGKLLSEYGYNPLDPAQGKIAKGECINVVQHPSGMHKQVVLQENRLLDLPENAPDWLHYESDTLPGSSGSPLFNNRWEVIGLHHAGWARRDEQGRILTKDGRIWDKSMGDHAVDWLGNEGARISRVLKKAEELARAQELTAEQEVLLRELLNPPKRGINVVPVAPQESTMNKTSPDPVNPKSNLTGTDGNQQPIPPKTLIEQASGLNDSQPVKSITETSVKNINAAAQQASLNGVVAFTVPLLITVSLGSEQQITTVDTKKISQETPTIKPRVDGFKRSEANREVAFKELENARTQTYFNAAADAIERDNYYRGINLSGTQGRDDLYHALSSLLSQTHINVLPYRPSVQLYPWVDLQPDFKLRSLYTDEVYEPEEIIEEALEIEAEFEARRNSLLANEANFDSDSFDESLFLLESSLAYNCEHVVPQSWFRGAQSRTPKGDLHHLFTCNSRCNSFRGNVPFFDFADFEESIMQGCGRKEGNKFEPSNGKGAAARATLYFLLRYPGIIDDNARELQAERINTVIAWHTQDTVSEYERHRNSAIYRKQGNRNPLIDFPELAGRINFVRGLGRNS